MMEMINLNRRSIGVNFQDAKAEITLWSPTSEQIAIVTDSGKLPLEKSEYGYWRLITNDIKPGTRYKFEINGKDQFPDPASLSQPDGVHERSEAMDITNFQWTDNQWNNIPLEEYIIYELHTGTFTEEGTFEAIEKKLDHLIELGINAIEIMPIAQFPGDRNWGYDGVFPFAVQNSYGGAEGLQRLIDVCHKKGLAVILDVVYNHMGPEGNYLGAYGPYFTNKYNTPWGNAINFDDAWCDGVRHFFIENALMWFRDFHVDALRLDAVHAIKDFSPVHILKEIKQYTDQLMQATGRTHYLIVELDLNDNRFINSTEEGGYGMDAQWIDEFHHALRITAGGERTGYYSDFTGIEHLAKSYVDAYVYDGQYSPHRNKRFGVKADKNEGKQFIVFSQNHDQVGNRMLGERTSELVSYEMQKLMAGAVMVSPFLPMLFMGEEWSDPNPFLYFVSHTDAELAEAVRKGRKEEFAAFHAQGEAPDPVSEETFNRSKLSWQLLSEDKHRTMFHFYKELIRIRKSTPTLSHLDRKKVEVDFNTAQQTLLLLRQHEEGDVMCLMNFSKEPQAFTMPSSEQWVQLLNSAESKWLGPLSESLYTEQNVQVQPESIIIYLKKNV